MPLNLAAVANRRAITAACLLAIVTAAAMTAAWLTLGTTSAGINSITVDSAGDADNATPGDATCDAVGGGCTLRAAVDVANSTIGTDMISFDIPGDGPHTISPDSPLPAFTEFIMIDGYTQPGAVANTLGALQGTNAVLMIELDGSNAGDGANGLVVNSRNSTIKGLVINNFDGSAIVLQNNQPLPNEQKTGNNVHGNFLGTDPSGNVARPNGVGVTIEESWYNFVGGISAAHTNLISGNEVGVVLTGNSMLNNVRGNVIGTARDGETALPNESHGVLLRNGAYCNTIGAEAPLSGQNIIAYNGGDGVSMEDDTGINNYVDPNLMHSNVGLGIDLNNDGVTPNDPDDLDEGPNDLQNFPVLTSAALNEEFGNLVVTGTLDSNPNIANAFMNLFFFLSDECDPSGYGEGSEFIEKKLFNNPADGNYEFALAILTDAEPGQFITATVSSPESTSEFSACMLITTGEPQLLQGDSNCDDDIGATDALSNLQFVAGFDPVQQPGCPEIGGPLPAANPAGLPVFGDVDCDNDVDATDALKVLQFLAGLPYTQNEFCPDIGDPL